MNFYIIVEGEKTEMSVYPAWLSLLAPAYTRIENFDDVNENNYYMNPNRFATAARFHLRYLQQMLEERNMSYSKSNTRAVQQQTYLQQLIKRYEETGHITTFGSWYEFVKAHFK